MASPVTSITLVNQNSFPFIGSVVTCNSDVTEIALACPASIADASEGICPYSPTIIYGASTWALTVTISNQLVHEQRSISCTASASTPKMCTSVFRSIVGDTTTYQPNTYSDTVDPEVDLTSAPVTLTAGLGNLCSPLPTAAGTAATTSSPMTTTNAVTSGSSMMPSQTSTRSSGLSNPTRNPLTNRLKYVLSVALICVQIANLY